MQKKDGVEDSVFCQIGASVHIDAEVRWYDGTGLFSESAGLDTQRLCPAVRFVVRVLWKLDFNEVCRAFRRCAEFVEVDILET